MEYSFEWDPEKAAANVAKHGIDFDEAASVFADPLAQWEPDGGLHSGEDRFVALGWSYAQRLLTVVFYDAPRTRPHHQRSQAHPPRGKGL